MNKRGMNPKLRVATTFLICILLLVTLYYLTKTFSTLTGYTITFYSKERMENFSGCLGERAVMYGSRDCHYCMEQRRMFEENFRYINYVDCDDLPATCVEAGVDSVPAWRVDGKNYFGIQTLRRLAEISGCSLK